MKPPNDVPQPARREKCPPGIVIRDGKTPSSPPLIRAFIWGGEEPALPTLPFGRWKPSTI